MTNAEELTQERGTTHGDFSDNARISQQLKAVLHCENADLTDIQREAIDMICLKLSRVVSGNPNEVDSWWDISGYAHLVARSMEKPPIGDMLQYTHESSSTDSGPCNQ